MDGDPDHKWFATGGDGAGLRIWETATGKLVKILFPPIPDYRYSVDWLDWSPTDQYLSAEYRSEHAKPGRITMLWDVAAGQVVYRGDDEMTPAWSPDGRYVVLTNGNTNPHFKIVDLAANSSTLVKTPANLTNNGIAWHHNDGRFVSAHTDGALRIWQVGSQEPIRVLHPEGTPQTVDIRGLDWSPDGQTIAAVSRNPLNKLLLWDATTGATRLPSIEWLYADRLRFSPDGRRIVGGAGQAYDFDQRQLLDMGGNKYLPGIWSSATDIIQGGEWGTIDRLLPWKKRQPMVRVNGQGRSISWSADGSRLAVERFVSGGVTSIYVWRANRSNQTATPLLLGKVVDGNGVTSGKFGGSGRLAAITNSLIQIFQCDEAIKKQAEWNQKPRPRDAKLSPNGKTIAVWSDDKMVKLLDAESGATTATWDIVDWKKAGSELLVWSPDGKKLALVGIDSTSHTVTIRNVADGKSLLSTQLGIGHSKNGGCWSPDSQRFAIGKNLYNLNGEETKAVAQGNTVAWSLAGDLLLQETPTPQSSDGKSATTLPGDFTYGHANDAQFSPDGRWLAAVADHGDLVRIWDARERRLHVTLCHDDTLPAFAISGDGHYRADGDLGDELVYVVLTDAGQETLTPAEFEQRFDWKNDPTKVAMPQVQLPKSNDKNQQ